MNPTTEDQVAEEGEEGLVVMLPEVYLQLVLPVEVVLLDIMVPVTLQTQMPKPLAIVFFCFSFPSRYLMHLLLRAIFSFLTLCNRCFDWLFLDTLLRGAR